MGEQEASFEQTRTGGIDINRTNMAPLASFVGKANIFGLPFLFRSADHLHRILDGAIGDELLHSLEPHGFVGLAFFEVAQARKLTRSRMRAATRIALATLLVLASASEVTAQRRHRAAQRGRAPPAEFQQHYPTTSPAVKPFTAEEAGWFARASKVY